jgi:hypothetical protein
MTGVDGGDVGEAKFGCAPIPDVAFGLFRVYVIGKKASPARTESRSGHSTTGKKLIEGGHPYSRVYRS